MTSERSQRSTDSRGFFMMTDQEFLFCLTSMKVDDVVPVGPDDTETSKLYVDPG